MPVFLVTMVEGWLGPRFAKYAKPLILVVLAILLVVGLGVAKCTYDRHVEKNYQQKTQERAAPATNQAASERATDTFNNAKAEQEMHNAIAAQPDQPISPTTHAQSCERLRRLGRHPASCS